MEFYQVALQVSVVLSLLILVGGAWALVRGSFNKARVQELREDNDDLRDRLDDAEKKIKTYEARETALETKVDHQQNEIDLLTNMLTQRAEVQDVKVAVVAVLENLKDHHDEAKQYWSSLNTAMMALLNERKQGL